MTIQHLYPTTRPSLDLNFAQQKRLDPRVTFTRGSTATYVGSDGLIKTAAANEARFDHDPVTGESLGLLNEWSQTNSFTYSNDISQSVYSKNNVTYTANAAVAPDGTTTATKIIPTTSSAVHSISRIGTVGADSMRSVYVKAAGYTSCTVYDTNTEARATINLTTGELTNTNYFNFDVYAEARGRITNAGNGWWRIEVGYDSYSAVNNPFHIYPNNNSTFAGDGTSGILVWGFQQVANAYPGGASYIPTTSSTVTRAAEVTTMTGTNFSSWYNQTEGSFILDERNSYTSYGGDVRFEIVQDSSPNTNSISFAVNYGAGTRFASRDSNSAGSFERTLSNVWTSGGSHKFAYGLEENNTSIVSGTNVTTDTSCTFPSNLDSLSIGGQGRGVSSVNPVGRVNIARLTYYPYRLTDAQLQALTL